MQRYWATAGFVRLPFPSQDKTTEGDLDVGHVIIITDKGVTQLQQFHAPIQFVAGRREQSAA